MNPEEGLDEAEALAALLVEESTIVPDAAPAATTVTLPAGFTITPELLAQGQALASQFLGGTAANTSALQALVERLAPSATPLTVEQNNERLQKLTQEFFTDPEALIKRVTTSAAPVQPVVDNALDPIYQQNGARTIKDFTKEKAGLFAKPAIYDAVKKEFDQILKENVSEGKPAAYHVGRMGEEQASKVLSQLWRTAYGTVGESQLIGRIAKVATTTGSGSGLGTSQSSGIQKFAETAAKAAATKQDGTVDPAKYKEYLSAALEGLE